MGVDRVRSTLAATLLAVVVASAAFASTAEASRYLRVGLFDDDQVLFGIPEDTFTRLRRTNARVLRVKVWWSGPHISVALRKPRRPADPRDPAYNWDTYDRTVRFAGANGMQLVFSIIGTPPWANEARGWNVAPTNPNDLRLFTIAVAKRYSGTFTTPEGVTLPRVSTWTAWNEPNLSVWLKPQFKRVNDAWTIQSARDYARICNAVVTGVKSVTPGSKVACGVTAPRGNNNPKGSRPSVAPLPFIRVMHQAGAKGFDAYAHHPYNQTRVETPSTPPPLGARGQPSAVTLGNIDVLIAEVTRLFGNKRIWLTEYGYQTNPPDSFFGVPWKKQAQYLTEAVDIARRHPRIDMFIWFLLVDEVRPEGFQSGLITVDGVRKPAYAAFQRAALG